MQLNLGKLPPEILEKYLLGMTGAPSDELVVAPSIGVDFGVVGRARRYLIVSSDPVTGVRERVGWYAVNVSANDVATSGNRPRYLQSIIMLPERASVKEVADISKEMHETSASLGITIVGGHTELTPGLKRPIVVTTVFCFAESYVTAADAKDGDSVIITKTAGVEGTAICASEWRGLAKKINPRTIARARGFINKLSIVEEAVGAYGTGGVHAMHDCTEGGVLGAVYEMSRASGLGFELDESEIPVAPETSEICSRLNLDPLRLISSGTLLIAVAPGGEDAVISAVEEAGSRATRIGRFRRGPRMLKRRGGTVEEITDAPTDELWKLMGRKRTRRSHPRRGIE